MDAASRPVPPSTQPPTCRSPSTPSILTVGSRQAARGPACRVPTTVQVLTRTGQSPTPLGVLLTALTAVIQASQPPDILESPAPLAGTNPRGEPGNSASQRKAEPGVFGTVPRCGWFCEDYHRLPSAVPCRAIDWKGWAAGKTTHARFPRRRYQETRKLKLFAVALGVAVPRARVGIAATQSPHREAAVV